MSINIIGILSIGLMVIGCVLIFALSRANAQTRPSPSGGDAFAKEVGAILKRVYPHTAFIYDGQEDTFKPAEPNDDSSDFKSLYLGNLRNRTLEMGRQDRETFIRDFLDQVSKPKDVTPELLRENLLMRNRTPEEFSLRQLMMTPDDGGDEFEPIIVAKGEMLLEPVLNSDTAVQPIDVKTMREHGFAFDEFLQIAAQNLLAITPPEAADHWEKLEENIWISKLSDDFDAARVFLFPEHIAFPFDGNLVVYAPSHAVCLITSREDEGTLGRMVELGNEYAQTHRPMSRALWQRGEGGWKRMQADNRNSVIGRARLIETLSAYDDQKSGLEQHFDKTQQDIHVAAVITHTKDEKADPPAIRTLSVFIGSGSYLPKTDDVILGFEDMSDSKPIDSVSWETLVQILGEESFQPHPDLKPVRYILKTELSDDQIAALHKASSPL